MDIQKVGKHAVVTMTKDQLTQLFHDLNRVMSLVDDIKLDCDASDRTSLQRLSNVLEKLQPHADE